MSRHRGDLPGGSEKTTLSHFLLLLQHCQVSSLIHSMNRPYALTMCGDKWTVLDGHDYANLIQYLIFTFYHSLKSLTRRGFGRCQEDSTTI